MRTATIVTVAVATLALAACGSAATKPATPSPGSGAPTVAASESCALQPAEDLIMWTLEPAQDPRAQTVGDVNLVACQKTVDTIVAPSGAGYCVEVARAADNPGYDDTTVPAPRLKKVIVSKGAGC